MRPWGVFGAVDLKTKSLFERPAGTVEDVVVGIRAGLPVPLGMPTLGGGIVDGVGPCLLCRNAGFLPARHGYRDRRRGLERPPAGGCPGHADELRPPATGKQYIVIVAGGARQSPVRGDYVIAYALPDKSKSSP